MPAVAMRISAIPQIYRHINRWREILAVLSKYELAAWIGRLGPDFAKDLLKARGGTSIARHGWRTRLRLALAELGPTFIKLGQVLSTRPDLVGVELATEFQHLQGDVPADPPAIVRQMIEAELMRPVEELFAEFDHVPMASASIGQVHRARLQSGEAVVVKVQHADIEKKIDVDMDILAGLAQLAQRIPEFQNYRPEAIVAEFKRAIRRELDFGREERNIQQFIRDFRDDPTVHIPRAYPELSTSRVLTMELVEGIKLVDVAAAPPEELDRAEIARRGANLYLKMIFSNGVYHADPHPGNILLMPHDVICLLDFGMVGRIDESLQQEFGEMLIAISNQDPEHLTSIIMRVGATPANLDRTALSLDVADFVAHYAGQPLDQFDLSGALNEMTEMIRNYRIMLPARIAMLIKVLVTLEGTSRMVSPRFSLVELMVPYQRKLLLRRLSPRRQLRRLRRIYSEMGHLLESLPRGLGEILEQIQSGKFDVHLDHRGLEPSVNRLVLGMLASAFFVGSSLLLSRNVAPLVRDLPLTHWIPLIQEISVPGMIGMGVSIALSLRLWRAINKSGHLDRR
jgi:ubiquinone biosynthesis protein